MRPLWHELALRSDYPEGTCWAWLEAAERVCGRPEGDEQHLCPRHARIASRKRARAAAKEAERRQCRAIVARTQLPGLREQLADVEARIAQLDRTAIFTDPASVNLPIGRRLPSEAAIHELALLHGRRTVLASAITSAEGAIARAERQAR